MTNISVKKDKSLVQQLLKLLYTEMVSQQMLLYHMLPQKLVSISVI